MGMVLLKGNVSLSLDQTHRSHSSCVSSLLLAVDKLAIPKLLDLSIAVAISKLGLFREVKKGEKAI